MKYQNIYNSTIGKGTKIGSYVEIANSDIGENCNIQAFVSISNNCVVGNNVFIGPGVRLLNDKYPPSGVCDPVVVEDNAVIGGGVVILPGVTIGEGSMIGAGSVVTKNVGKEEVWYGNPAKFHSRR